MKTAGSQIVRNGFSQNIDKQYQCQHCQLIFQNQQQLYNHHKNFCVNSGFDTLVGLNIKLKNPILGEKKRQTKVTKQSLLNALDELQKNKQFQPYQKQLQRDMKILKDHQQTINYSRPYYLKTSSKVENSRNNPIYSSKSFSNNQQPNQKNFTIKSNKYSKANKSYSLHSSDHLKKEDEFQYISPPTQDYRNKISILNKSNNSIKNMSQTQKKQYTLKKQLQLEQIQQNYKKNGGKDKQFIQSINKMKNFYKNLQKSEKIISSQETLVNSQVSRVSTPILKLRNFQKSIVGQSQSIDLRPQIDKRLKNVKQNNIYGIKGNQWAKRQQKMIKTVKQSQIEFENEVNTNIKNRYGKDNQIIVIPYPQSNPYIQNKTLQASNNFKLLEEIMKIKGEQNNKLISILQKMNYQTKVKYQQQLKNRQKQIKKNEKMFKKLQGQNRKIKEEQHRLAERQFNQPFLQSQQKNSDNKFRVKQNFGKLRTQPTQQYRSRNKKILNVRQLNLQKKGFIDDQNLQIQDKVLRQMQQEERDQFQILSNLPKELQQIKMQSIKKVTEARVLVQKQIYAQKMQKLNLFQKYHEFSLQRKLDGEDLQNCNRKIKIKNLIKKQVKQFAKNEYQQNQSDYQSDEQKFNNEDQESIIRENSIENGENSIQTNV